MTACYFVEQPLLSVKKSRISLLGMKRLRGNKLILIRLRLSLVCPLNIYVLLKKEKEDGKEIHINMIFFIKKKKGNEIKLIYP